MKRSLLLLAISGALSVASPAFAHGGWGHGGGHGYYGGGHGYYGGGRWIGPVLGAAVVGSAVYAATYPRVVYSQPVVVAPPPVVMDPARVAYFCNSYQQYYPQVATCPVPWQVVPY